MQRMRLQVPIVVLLHARSTVINLATFSTSFDTIRIFAIRISYLLLLAKTLLACQTLLRFHGLLINLLSNFRAMFLVPVKEKDSRSQL